MWYRTGDPVRRTIYLYVRTKTAVYNAELFYNSKLAGPHTVSVLETDQSTWQNGLVIRFRIAFDIPDLAVALADDLERFDAWAMYDDMGSFVEEPRGGLFGRYFDAANEAGVKAARRSQLFILYDDAYHAHDRITAQVRSYLPAPCFPVFVLRMDKFSSLGLGSPPKSR